MKATEIFIEGERNLAVAKQRRLVYVTDNNQLVPFGKNQTRFFINYFRGLACSNPAVFGNSNFPAKKKNVMSYSYHFFLAFQALATPSSSLNQFRCKINRCDVTHQTLARIARRPGESVAMATCELHGNCTTTASKKLRLSVFVYASCLEVWNFCLT